jgi:hypothetical protein
LHKGETDFEHEVYVLKGGFSEFQMFFRVRTTNTPIVSTLRFFSMTPS